MIAALMLASAISCAPAQHITVAGTDWIRTPGNFAGGNTCLNAWDGRTVSFKIKSQSAPTPVTGGVSAYPNLMRGCSFPPARGLGPCALPWTARRANAMAGATITWDTSHAKTAASARYNTGADLWFSPNRKFWAPATEVMVWLNAQNQFPPAGTITVTIGGTKWDYWTEPAGGGSRKWTEIIFQHARPVSSVTKLPLAPLVSYATSRGAMSARSWWQSAALGFELWKGGAGLRVISGWVHP